MQQATALKAAIDLLHVPTRVRALRSQPLPEGVALLIEIAAGDDAATSHAIEVSERPQQVVEDAATFFIEQILLSTDSDSYRILGTDHDAHATELRRNMALLLKWLHPDLDRDGGRSIYAGRVTGAWEDLKTPQRRRQYDIGNTAHSIHGPVGGAANKPNSGAVRPKANSQVRPQVWSGRRGHPHASRAVSKAASSPRNTIPNPSRLRRIFRFLLGRPQF